jgi:hypothetical protein
MLVALLLVLGLSGSAAAATITLNFDSVPVDTINDPKGYGDPTAYLAGYGITMSHTYIKNATFPQDALLGVADDRWIYDDGADDTPYAVLAPSRYNVFSQWFNNGPLTFTLHFSSPMSDVGFASVGLKPGGPATTFPAWAAEAYDSNSNVIDSVFQSGGSNRTTSTFTLSAPSSVITSVTFFRDGTRGTSYQNFSAFAHVMIDDLTITGPGVIPEPATITLLAAGALGLLGYGWRRKRR